MHYHHVPVMLKEVLEYLDPRPGQNFIDCTLGGGGYTIELARKALPRGKVLAVDLDELAIDNARRNIKNKNVILVHDNFKNLRQIIKDNWPDQQDAGFAGIVFDLGLSSAQLQDKHRGFSFQLDAPLNMAFGHTRIAANYDTGHIVNFWKERELERVLREYGEERYAKRIAGAIVKMRGSVPVKTTGELVEIIEKAVPKKYLHDKIHPATRTFQALRIATNHELENLREALPQAADLLASGGRIAVISYHSLEDRVVKIFFKRESKECLCPPALPVCQCGHQAKLKIITKKVVIPGAEEVKNNPRSRSAKMRVAEKLEVT